LLLSEGVIFVNLSGRHQYKLIFINQLVSFPWVINQHGKILRALLESLSDNLIGAT